MSIFRSLLTFPACFLAVLLIAAPDARAGCDNDEFDPAVVAGGPIPTTAPYNGWAGVDLGNVKRPFCLVIPPSYDGSRHVPLILVFHGGKNSAEAYRRKRRELLDLVLPEGVVVAFAQGYRPDEHVGQATWNAIHCCGPSFERGIDDVAYAAAIVDNLKASLMIDPARVYAAGGSNGGMLVHRLAADRPDLFAAVAASAASVGGQPAEGAPLVEVQPRAAIPIMLIHGVLDQAVKYGGGISRSEGRRDLSFANSVGLWVWNNDCDLDPEEPASTRDEVRIQRYVGCAADSEVVAVSIANHHHGWPPHADRLVVEFFKRHAKASP